VALVHLVSPPLHGAPPTALLCLRFGYLMEPTPCRIVRWLGILPRTMCACVCAHAITLSLSLFLLCVSRFATMRPTPGPRTAGGTLKEEGLEMFRRMMRGESDGSLGSPAGSPQQHQEVAPARGPGKLCPRVTCADVVREARSGAALAHLMTVALAQVPVLSPSPQPAYCAKGRRH
jgi:hypothetical protein